MLTYIHESGPLFEAVQTGRVFADNKTFPDCIPKTSLEEIVALFLSEKDEPGFDLGAFVSTWFDLPPHSSVSYESDKSMGLKAHIEELWEVLEREPSAEVSSLIPLPHPYIVPGGRFREVYYWDSYFTMLGLQVSGKTEMIRHMVDNFSYLLHEAGHIPNANRTYYIGRSQPPFYALMVELLAKTTGTHLYASYLPFLEKEYAFWMNGKDSLSAAHGASHRVVRMPEGSVLNRFWDEHDSARPESFVEDTELARISDQEPARLFRNLRAAAESGWDFSSRWFKEINKFESIHTTDILPVDLNCLLYFLEKTLEVASVITNQSERALMYQQLADQRKTAIETYCWNEEKGFYFDYDFVEGRQKKHYTLAACYPLFFKLAAAEQAEAVAGVLEKQFLGEGGLLTTLEYSGQQWDAPNGWAPLQWMAYKGLKNYELSELAGKIRDNWTSLNLKVYRETGKMTEKYNVSDTNIGATGGEYPNQDGFGWTNGVYLKMTES